MSKSQVNKQQQQKTPLRAEEVMLECECICSALLYPQSWKLFICLKLRLLTENLTTDKKKNMKKNPTVHLGSMEHWSILQLIVFGNFTAVVPPHCDHQPHFLSSTKHQTNTCTLFSWNRVHVLKCSFLAHVGATNTTFNTVSMTNNRWNKSERLSVRERNF